MTPSEISDVVYQRMCCTWRQQMLAQNAVPVILLGVSMLEDAEYGRTVMCTIEGFSAAQLATFLEDCGEQLRKNGFEKGLPKFFET